MSYTTLRSLARRGAALLALVGLLSTSLPALAATKTPSPRTVLREMVKRMQTNNTMHVAGSVTVEERMQYQGSKPSVTGGTLDMDGYIDATDQTNPRLSFSFSGHSTI